MQTAIATAVIVAVLFLAACSTEWSDADIEGITDACYSKLSSLRGTIDVTQYSCTDTVIALQIAQCTIEEAHEYLTALAVDDFDSAVPTCLGG